MSEYWSASRHRLDRWSKSLRSLSLTSAESQKCEFEFVPAVVEPLFHEIFASEILTRVWAAVVSLFDAPSGQAAATAVARSVLMSQQEVRYRALDWLLCGPLAETPHADAVNVVRRRCERWSDLLIANVYSLGDVAEFAFDAIRTGEFAQDFAEERRTGTYPAAWAMTLASLRAALHAGLTRESFSRDANRRISAGVLACLGPKLFTSTGSLRTAWLMRMSRVTADTEGMLSELLALEAPRTPWEQRLNG